MSIFKGNNGYGTMELDGIIDEFANGGQELWLIDVCPE